MRLREGGRNTSGKEEEEKEEDDTSGNGNPTAASRTVAVSIEDTIKQANELVQEAEQLFKQRTSDHAGSGRRRTAIQAADDVEPMRQEQKDVELQQMVSNVCAAHFKRREQQEQELKRAQEFKWGCEFYNYKRGGEK